MQYSWDSLISAISELFTSGKTEVEISQILAGSILVGAGTIERIETDPEYSQFIQVFMPRIEIPHGNKKIVADFIALNFEKLESNLVKHLEKGDMLEFETTLIESNGPFPGISISEDAEDVEILIMPGTKGSKIA